MNNYKELYKQKLTTPQNIISQLKSGWTCAADIACSMPPAILNALGELAAANKIHDIKIHSILDLQPHMALSAEASKGVLPITWFSGSGLARAVNEGRGDLMPCYYRDMPQLFDQYTEIDALFICVSPMDKHGYFSTGVTGSNSETLIRKAKKIYLEVNDQMPRALSAPLVHISQVEALCENSSELPISPPAKLDDISLKIAQVIADEIPNGATLQLGIGAIPEAVGLALKGKKDLGLHTELFTDSMVELLECGAVTNEKKPIYRGKTVATLAFGSKRLYDYIDDNPAFCMLPVNWVNDPAVIAKHPDFISVNSALEIDFYGQVCAESLGTRHVSGSGGQADYVRGATQSKGGKSFIAFPSTAMHGKVSRIRPTLTPGAIVTTGKNDVDYIVTEYGAAKLRGKTLSERTKSLIGIAHPNFREELTSQAKKQNIII